MPRPIFNSSYLANDLRAFMTKQECTQTDVAYWCNVSTATISDLVNREYCHSINLLLEVCHLIETSPNKYFKVGK